MAIVSRRVSDVSNIELPESEMGTLSVRSHPAFPSSREIDVAPEDVKDLKVSDDVVVAALKLPGQEPQVIILPVAAFRKTIPDSALQKGRGIRGKQPANLV